MGVTLGLVILMVLGYRIFCYAPTVPVIQKNREIQGKVFGPGTVQSRCRWR